MESPLAPCPHCCRHARVTDPRCPFCGADFPGSFAQSAVPGATGRLSRAAAYAFGATLAVAGCGSSVGPADAEPTDVPADVQPTDSASEVGQVDTGPGDTGPADDGTLMGAYGVPPPPDARVDTGPADNGAIAPPYGVPPPPDAG